MNPTCYDIKMSQFISALLGKTIIEGFEKIYSEYIGLRENKSATYLLSLINEIDYMRSKQFVIFKVVEVLAEIYDIRLVAELKNKGCKGKFNPDNKEQFSNDLRAAVTYGKRFNGLIKIKEKEIEVFKSKSGGQEVNEKFFEDLAATLEKYYGHYIDFDTLTVARFVSKWNQYDKYCEVMNAEQNNMIKNKGYGR